MPIQVHHFEGDGIGYQVLRFENHCLWIWIGSSKDLGPELNSISVSLDGANSSPLLGIPEEFDPSQTWSSKLSKRLGKPVFLSYNLPSEVSDPLTQSQILKRLFEELKAVPHLF